LNQDEALGGGCWHDETEGVKRKSGLEKWSEIC
jgi:hypothetical protein